MDGGFPQLYRNIYREKVKYQFACFGENRRNLTGFQICHSEERSDVGISQYPAASWESYRRKRNCLPEIAPQGHFLALRAQGATSAFGLLAMTSLGALHIRRKYLQICSCQRRSLTAATDAIGAYRFHGGRYESAALHREGHAPPLQRIAGSYGKAPLSTLNFRRPAGGYPQTGISSNPGRAPMPRRGSDCSRPDCAPRPPRASARRPAA